MNSVTRCFGWSKRALLAGTLLLLVLGIFFVFPQMQFAAPDTERLANGSFEEGFVATPAGEVGIGWHWFHSGGAATYSFYRDTWAPVVYDGSDSQLIEISTYGPGGHEADRYAGIYQTVAVVPGETYQLTVRGMLRALEEDPDRAGYNYGVEFGIDFGGGTDWTLVDSWFEIPWDKVHPRLSPGPIDSFGTSVTATGNRLTLFFRAWKKWGTSERMFDVNLDGISLKGPLPVDANAAGEMEGVAKGDVAGAPKLWLSLEVPEYPVVGMDHVVKVRGMNDVGVTMLELYADGVLVDSVSYRVGPLSATKGFTWRPKRAGRHVLKAVARDVADARVHQEVEVVVGKRVQFLTNGGFERGFRATPVGMVGKSWGWFDNGGRANFGAFDDTWPPVVQTGAHSQLIFINTLGWDQSENDRYAGIYQTVRGLTVGAEYVLSLSGMLRGLSTDGDRNLHNYRLEWGYAAFGETDWRAVGNWNRVPWDEVHSLLEPGSMDEFRTSFKAPSGKVTLFFRVWKMWGTADREVDVNLDDIRLFGYYR